MATLSGIPDRISLTAYVGEDKYLPLVLTSGTDIGGVSLEWHLMRRKGQISTVSGALTSGLVKKSAANGYSAVSGGDPVSGIIIRNSGQGIADVYLTQADTSGLKRGNYWYEFHLVTSGSRAVHAHGFLSLQ